MDRELGKDIPAGAKADVEQELKDYEMSLLGRELAIREVRESITRQRKNLYNKPPKQTVINF